eukprot:COSAG01_NODE_22147_length_869_cov_3.253247_1_plen_39_part_10
MADTGVARWLCPAAIAPEVIAAAADTAVDLILKRGAPAC